MNLKESIGVLGIDRVLASLPKPFLLSYSHHDTGCQIDISAEGEVVWRYSEWFHPRYEFNEARKVRGFQPDFEFTRPVLMGFFLDMRDAAESKKAVRAANEIAREAAADAARKEKIERIRQSIAA